MVDRPYTKQINKVFGYLYEFDGFVDHNFKNRKFTLDQIKDLSDYIKNAESADEILFMDTRSSYISASGVTGVLDVTNDIIQLFGEKKPMVKYLNWADGQSRYTIAVPVEEFTVDGKTCNAIVALFKPEVMNDFFKIESFDEQAKVYVLDNTGIVIFTNDDNSIGGSNILSRHKAEGIFSAEQVERIKKDFADIKEGIITVKKDDATTFFAYCPNEKYNIVLEVPEEIAAHEMNQLQHIIWGSSIVIVVILMIAVIAIIVLMLTSSKRQALAAEAEKGREAAEVANVAKTKFLNNMSHDIRTPMNAIIGYTSMAQNHIDDKEKVLDFLGKIGKAGNNLLDLINQVLDMSRIESGKVKLSEDPVDLVEKAHEMEDIVRHSAESKNIELSLCLSDIRDRLVYADSGRMNQLILNLLGNSVKYTPEGGKISYSVNQLQCDKPGYGTYHFTIEDNGIGMSKEYLEKVFEPFSRETTEATYKIQGTGLGMAIVKKLVDLMGGSIEIESELGKGTKIDITITFRLQEEEKIAAAQDVHKVDANLMKGKRVLLVEDNEMNREIASMILEAHGLIVEKTEDGDLAVAIMKELADKKDWHHFDFILMDVQMPRMDGYEATKAIRAIPAPEGVHIPIIAMTANAFAEDRQIALDSGMDEHVAKPIDVDVLWETLAKLV